MAKKRIKLKYRRVNAATEQKIRALWKRYAKRLSSKAKKALLDGNFDVKSLGWTTTEVEELTKLLNAGYEQLTKKTVFTMDFLNKRYKIPEIDRTELKNNEKIYSSFLEMRNEHISYFKRFPTYVYGKYVKYSKEFFDEMEKQKETVSFDGKKYAEILAKCDGISERHAAFTARDQLGKFNASINESQNKYVGATEYVWRGMLDNRERKTHVEREGKVFRYDKPPEDGHAGMPVRCRCYQEAILEM